MKKMLTCPTCESDYAHLIGTLQVTDNDERQTTEVVVNHQHSIPVQVHYEYRSQGNLHILFRCESGHFFIKSFDGHKGNVFVDENPLMDELVNHLNHAYKDDNGSSLSFDYELLGNIEKFLKQKQSS